MGGLTRTAEKLAGRLFAAGEIGGRGRTGRGASARAIGLC